jgi:hypothetical protein
MAGMEQLEIHSKVYEILEYDRAEELTLLAVVYRALGQGGGRPYNIMECSTAQEIYVRHSQPLDRTSC